MGSVRERVVRGDVQVGLGVAVALEVELVAPDLALQVEHLPQRQWHAKHGNQPGQDSGEGLRDRANLLQGQSIRQHRAHRRETCPHAAPPPLAVRSSQCSRATRPYGGLCRKGRSASSVWARWAKPPVGDPATEPRASTGRPYALWASSESRARIAWTVAARPA